jgi:methionyl-tRNA synthetase
MSDQNFYITTTLPYVNAEPHIGFALEIIAADVIARYQKSMGKKVIFNTGTDEHGQKIYQKALENNQDPQEYVDFWAEKFEDLKKLLNLEYSNFIRTTDPNHIKAAQKFWEICLKNGFIYKDKYEAKYCVGCEMEKQDSELVEGKCPLHPNRELEIRKEENYFFKFSEFQQPLLDLYQSQSEFVKPQGKFNEIKSFIESGLKDFSISRLKTKMPWGIEVPGDKDHVMYVWFDALVNYISTLGWPDDLTNFENFWPGIQIAGKDNLRQQSAMWQAMLLAAGLPASKQILINGFISIDGQKMSKSLGNVISPTEMVEKYGSDATRFLLMFSGPIGSDIDTSWEKLDEIYTAHLANGIGNLCSRVAKMCEKSGLKGQNSQTNSKTQSKWLETYHNHMAQFEIKEAIDLIVTQISQTDQFLSQEKPWTKQGQEQAQILHQAVAQIVDIIQALAPFMPQLSTQIENHFTGEQITALKPLFPRINN